MDEKFSVKTWLLGYISPLTWWKNGNRLIQIGLILLVGWTIYKAWVYKPPFIQKPIQETHITVSEGATLNLKQEQKTSQSAATKWFSPFVEGYGFSEQYNGETRNGYGVRYGIRISF